MTRAVLVLALAGALAVAGCADPDPTAEPSGPTSTQATQSPSPDRATSDPTASTTPSASAPAGSAPAPVAAPLGWEPTLRPVEESVTTGGGWTIVVDQERSLATVAGPTPRTVAGDKRFRISDVLLDTGYAVVVTSDSLEERPAIATVIDLATGRKSRVDGRSDVPTTTGGTWALQGTRLVHATVAEDGAYCLAERDLTAGTAVVSWCAERRQGFSNALVTPAGVTVLAFDDQRPSCRTLGSVAGSALEPLPDVTECKAWEGAVTDGGAVWSVIPKETDLDDARVYARTADGIVELGPATAGTLTWCGGATYFVRDPRTQGEPARLLRWTDAGVFETVYESGGGQAFLTGPRCGGDRITLSAYSESGDEQVSAPLG